jgi:Zn-finger nucleic acid-binding protein
MTEPRTAPEPRLACPVCLGVTMRKVDLAGEQPLRLDHCARCGGVWFDAGEVQRLRGVDPGSFWRAVARRDDVARVQCHSCHGFIGRADAPCPACGFHNVLDCPKCTGAMTTATHDDIELDVCRRCRGVWFDHAELEAVWRMRPGERPLAPRDPRAGDGAVVLSDALLFDPLLVWYGAHLAMHGAAAASNVAAAAGPGLAAGAAEAAGLASGGLAGAAEAFGDAATGVFETLLDIIGGIFS